MRSFFLSIRVVKIPYERIGRDIAYYIFDILRCRKKQDMLTLCLIFEEQILVQCSCKLHLFRESILSYTKAWYMCHAICAMHKDLPA